MKPVPKTLKVCWRCGGPLIDQISLDEHIAKKCTQCGGTQHYDK